LTRWIAIRLIGKTIGPKVKAGSDNLQAVQSELRLAADAPEFRDTGEKLLEALPSKPKAAHGAALPNGGNAFRKAFVDAMAMRLKRLP
jgi:hypothetical protein